MSFTAALPVRRLTRSRRPFRGSLGLFQRRSWYGRTIGCCTGVYLSIALDFFYMPGLVVWHSNGSDLPFIWKSVLEQLRLIYNDEWFEGLRADLRVTWRNLGCPTRCKYFSRSHFLQLLCRPAQRLELNKRWTSQCSLLSNKVGTYYWKYHCPKNSQLGYYTLNEEMYTWTKF